MSTSAVDILPSSEQVADWESRKNAANEDMKRGDYSAALVKYEYVLGCLDALDASMGSSSGQQLDLHRPMHIACLNNASMAYLRLAQHDECVRACSKSLQIDEHNLKARYRRSMAFLAQAKACDDSPDTLVEAEELWGRAMQDVQSLLESEPLNAQAKELKNNIRTAKADQEKDRKLRLRYGPKETRHNFAGLKGEDDPDLPSVYDSDNGEADEDREGQGDGKAASRAHAPGSVFQSFPALDPDPNDPSAANKGKGMARTMEGAALAGEKPASQFFETAVSRDLAAETIAAHSGIKAIKSTARTTEGDMQRQVEKEQQQLAEKNKGSYAFLDPTWVPPTETETAGSDEIMSSSAQGGGGCLRTGPSDYASTVSATAVAANNAAAVTKQQSLRMVSVGRSSDSGKKMSGGSTSGTVGGGSFTDLLRKAKAKNAPTASTSGSSSFGTSVLPNVQTSQKVNDTLTALQQSELAAKQLVGDTLRKQEMAAKREKNRELSRLAQRSALFEEEKERLRKEPTVRSAWEELMSGEKSAQDQYRKQISSRVGNDGVATPKQGDIGKNRVRGRGTTPDSDDDEDDQ